MYYLFEIKLERYDQLYHQKMISKIFVIIIQNDQIVVITSSVTSNPDSL